MSYVFGPVPSRRLGRSLGVDLVPFKECTYDCVYCQLGWTTDKTIQRKEWVPLEQVVSDLKEKLSTKPDYITLSGSGEPTLYSRIGELIEAIKKMTDIPVAVLTNGSLLWMPQVRESLLKADLVAPSLDAGSKVSFQAINRPADEIEFDQMVEGLKTFRKEYKGKLWLEVFFIEGINTSEKEIERMAKLAQEIGADRVQLNTISRPPAQKNAQAVAKEKLEQIAKQFGDHAEIIADYQKVHELDAFKARKEDILELLRRRPCSIEDIAQGLGLHRNEVIKYTEELVSEGKIQPETQRNRVYYLPAGDVRN